MGGHMALVASEVFRAPAILFNPAPRVAAAAKLAAAWTLAAPLQVANILTLGVSRKIGNVFNSRGVAGSSSPVGGFWRVIAPRESGIFSGLAETMEWISTMTPVPGNGMTIIHAFAGDHLPAIYFNPSATGYELHLYPPISRRTSIGAHDMSVMALLPRRNPGTPNGYRPPAPLQFPELQGSKDSEAITLEYPQACLAIYDKWAAEMEITELRPAGTKLAALLQVGDKFKRDALGKAEQEVVELNRRNVWERSAIKAWRAISGAAASHVFGATAGAKITAASGQLTKGSGQRNAAAGGNGNNGNIANNGGNGGNGRGNP